MTASLRLGLQVPARISAVAQPVVAPWKNRFAREGPECVELFEAVRKLSRLGEDVIVYPDAEQLLDRAAHMRVVQTITRKAFLTEMDLLRLQKALLMARMAANSTFLVDKEPPGFSSKLDALSELLEPLCAEPGRKLILFSEWTTMLDLVQPLLERLKAGFVRLDGSVPQKQRQQLVSKF